MPAYQREIAVPRQKWSSRPACLRTSSDLLFGTCSHTLFTCLHTLFTCLLVYIPLVICLEGSSPIDSYTSTPLVCGLVVWHLFTYLVYMACLLTCLLVYIPLMICPEGSLRGNRLAGWRTPSRPSVVYGRCPAVRAHSQWQWAGRDRSHFVWWSAYWYLAIWSTWRGRLVRMEDFLGWLQLWWEWKLRVSHRGPVVWLQYLQLQGCRFKSPKLITDFTMTVKYVLQSSYWLTESQFLDLCNS